MSEITFDYLINFTFINVLDDAGDVNEIYAIKGSIPLDELEQLLDKFSNSFKEHNSNIFELYLREKGYEIIRVPAFIFYPPTKKGSG